MQRLEPVIDTGLCLGWLQPLTGCADVRARVGEVEGDVAAADLEATVAKGRVAQAMPCRSRRQIHGRARCVRVFVCVCAGREGERERGREGGREGGSERASERAKEVKKQHSSHWGSVHRHTPNAKAGVTP